MLLLSPPALLVCSMDNIDLCPQPGNVLIAFAESMNCALAPSHQTSATQQPTQPAPTL